MSGSGVRMRKPPKRLLVTLGTSKSYDETDSGAKRARRASTSSAAAAAPTTLLPLTDVAFGEILGALANDKKGEALLLAKIKGFDLTTWGSASANTTTKRGKKYHEDILTYALKLGNPWPFTVLIDAGAKATLDHLDLISKGKRRPSFVAKALESLTAQHIETPPPLRTALAEKYPDIIAGPSSEVSDSDSGSEFVGSQDDEAVAEVSEAARSAEDITKTDPLARQQEAALQRFQAAVERGYVIYSAEFDFFHDSIKALNLDQILSSFLSLIISNGYYKDTLWQLIKEYNCGDDGAFRCFRDLFATCFDTYEYQTAATYQTERYLSAILHKTLNAIKQDVTNTNVDFVQYYSTARIVMDEFAEQAYQERVRGGMHLYNTKWVPDLTADYQINCHLIRQCAEILEHRLNKLRTLLELFQSIQESFLDIIDAECDALTTAHGIDLNATKILEICCPDVYRQIQEHKTTKNLLLSNIANVLNDICAWYQKYRTRLIDKPASPRPANKSFNGPMRFSVPAPQTSLAVTSIVKVSEPELLVARKPLF